MSGHETLFDGCYIKSWSRILPMSVQSIRNGTSRGCRNNRAGPGSLPLWRGKVRVQKASQQCWILNIALPDPTNTGELS
ncbi:MAG TPA: hypothetical protein DDY14_15800 [Chromatiaceae bacterium]|nr:MAG: hypothetical protein N838_06360 [Thiohalocapsa sp. PB-PSB1]HBG96746.1 hypothetical protein [Chromatiaceae bacterium]HCS90414.1 hypothetical protein [Chromatiaceae bacterium]